MIANDPDATLQSQVEEALISPQKQHDLLLKPDLLVKILNSISMRQWLFEASHDAANPNRAFKVRLIIILIMQKSNKIWCDQNSSNEDYQEALARAWLWFGEHFDEYDPEKASFVTWFNNKLKYLILDVTQEQAKKRKWEKSLDAGENTQTIEIADPVIPSIETKVFYDQIKDLVQYDPGGYLRKCYMQDNLKVNCQNVILAILQSQPISPNIPWEKIAGQLEVDSERLRSFSNRTAFPRFRKFCSLNGISRL